jgi:hypothetical protein
MKNRMDEMKKDIAIVFFAFTSLRECSEPGTFMRKRRNARTKEVTIAMISDSSILNTTLASPDILIIDS